MAGLVSRQQQAGTSISAADGVPAAADHHLRGEERQKRLSMLLDKQAQPRQEKKTLLMQLQRLQQELGLGAPNNHTQAPATVAGTNIASALDSLAAAAAAATEPRTHGQQQLQQHLQHMQAPQLPRTDPRTDRDKLSPTENPESGEQADTRSQKRTLEQAKTDDTGSVAGPGPEVLQATAGPASGDQLNSFTAAAAISPGGLASKGSATRPRQQQLAGSAGGNNLAAHLSTHSNSSALQPQRKRARMHEAQAHHFQVAKQFQQHYQQQMLLQGQGQTEGQDQLKSHLQDSSLTAQTSSNPKPRTESLQQVLHQQVQQLLLPELNRQAIQQSLDPTTQCMVECGSATGIFCVDRERISCLCKICSQNKGQHKPEFSPSEFERHGGMAACKKWRFSIKVADGGPGMTLGRWLDMRGIQISSYPTKFKHPVAKSKRPLESARGLGVGQTDTPPGSQLDLAQLLASLKGSNARAAGPTKAAASSSTASAVAAVSQVLADKACNNGAATASSNDTLKQLAAAVAELLAEVPPAALELSAATLMSNQQQQAATAAATVDIPSTVINGASPGGPPATDEPSVSTCLWPEAATVDANDLPAGYAVAAQAAADAAEGGHRAALQGRHSLQSPLSAGRGSIQSDPEPQQQQLGLVPSRSSVSTPLHLPSLVSWGSAGLQTTQRQQHVASMAPPAVAGRANAVLPAHASFSCSGWEPAVPRTSPDCNGAAVGHRSSGEASAGFSLPGHSSLGHLLHRSPRPVAPASAQQGGLTTSNHHHHQQHQYREQLVQLQRRASLGTQNGLAPATTTVSAHAAGVGPSHSAGVYPAAAAADQVASAAAAADWGKIVGSLESRLDLLLEDRKRRMQLEAQVAVLTEQVLLMQQQLKYERRLRDVAEQQLASLSALLMQKLDPRWDDGAAQQQHMVAAVDIDADAVLPAASAEGAVDGEFSLTVGAAAPDLAVDQTPGHVAQQHSDEATTGTEAATNGGTQEPGESDGPTVGLTIDDSFGNEVHAHKGSGQLPVIKQENDVDAVAVDKVTAKPAEEHVSGAAIEQSPTPSNGVNGALRHVA